ncbi:GNAT family N-acetyltransferase [Rathayibacter soli]|uniref:GNAT family N-acetyltransferase n=1 Tax=Rathayibacter soli TaxID=3144168 RepID=UPI0027E4571D|nr:GNAT family N-acetyltransferase [Glaciibacter superstes]
MTFADAAVDAESAERLEQHGLRLGLVDTADRAAFTAWLHADARGFYQPHTSPKQLEALLAHTAYRRTTGVWDDTETDAATPVATVSSWPAPLALPGENDMSAWAISSVTVAPTHRRRGIARALLEAELRTAHALGVPAAILTASEATIYSRYGFGPAARAAQLTIDTRRARWAGPTASGRVRFVTLEQLQADGRPVFERARSRQPGEIALDDALWAELLGVMGDDEDELKHLRAVRYDDAAGVAQGFTVYRVSGGDEDFSQHTVTVRYLCAATDDAYAGLWHFLVDLDLVTSVVAPLRSVDEPVIWQLSDVRAVTTSGLSDQLWLRILDVKAMLEARSYSAPAQLVLDIADPLGYANGRILLAIGTDGRAGVAPLPDAALESAADASGGPALADFAPFGLALSITDLSSLSLGGASARTLVRAGRITELAPGSADVFDTAFRSPITPTLSLWF